MLDIFSRRIRVLKLFFAAVFVVFVVRLFGLQVIEYESFAEQAKAQHQKRSILPAQRGKILVRKNRLIDEYTPLATNNTLKMLFVDPLVLAYPKYNPNIDLSQQERGNPVLAAQLIAPLLLYSHCEKAEGCEIELDADKWSETERFAVNLYQNELEKLFTQLERRRIILIEGLAESRIKVIEKLNLPGIWIENDRLLADPKGILDEQQVAEELSPVINIPESDIREYLKRTVKRYVEITNKIEPDISTKILELKENPKYRDVLRGVQLRDEQWRYYPERSLAAQVLGFVNATGRGQYGIEGRFDQDLAGKEGVIFGATNTRGQQILGKDSQISRAYDGADIVLSLDRVIQGQVEKILAEDTSQFLADSGQVIVVEPKTGRILAMAHYPTFDPNEFQKAFAQYEIDPERESLDREDPGFNQRIPTIKDPEQGKFFRYFNTWGPRVFRNKIVADTYEPGSVMKAVTMAAAINANEVTPQTTFNDNGPIEVDEFKIRNSDKVYAGVTSMISVLSRSLNTGIAFITQKMGAQLLYEYLKNFGFGQYTFIELDGEAEGKMEFWEKWTPSELVTRGFGQGITATPLQMVMAFSALANGGYLMKPLLVEEILYPDGTSKKFHTEVVRRVISNDTYNTVKAMLLHTVNKGIARGAGVWGYSVMGKTGTSQTYKNGKALEGAGTTITSFAGFGPIQEPAFVILVKYDHPKSSQWGSETAAVTFRKVAQFLFQHLGIPPDQ